MDGETPLHRDDCGVNLRGQAVGDGPAAGEVPGPLAVEEGELLAGADVDGVELVGVLVTWSGNGLEKPNPGKEGTITSNASAGLPPWAPGSANGSTTLEQCQNVQGQPCVRISGVGAGPVPGQRMKWTGTPSTSTR
jgi:hypothetical protein